MSSTNEVEKLTMANTKKEMLQAYRKLLKQLEEKQQRELKTDDVVAERERAKAVAVADSVAKEGITEQIASLKTQIGRTLNDLADRLEQETAKYVQVKKAVAVAEAELHEIYEIEKAAASLAALLEAHKQEEAKFQAEMLERRTALEDEIRTHQEVFDQQVKEQREEWKKEKAEHEVLVKERDAADKKRRQREQEEWQYQFEREKQAAIEQREIELARLNREIETKKEMLEKVLAEREQAIVAAENELESLRDRTANFPAELDQAVASAIQETTERLERERKYAIDLLKKEYAGERNVLSSRIEALQATVDKQAEQIARLSEQLEHSYGQVQDIALKAIEGSAVSRSVAQTPGSLSNDRLQGRDDFRP